jgi:hypothetical protein
MQHARSAGVSPRNTDCEPPHPRNSRNALCYLLARFFTLKFPQTICISRVVASGDSSRPRDLRIANEPVSLISTEPLRQRTHKFVGHDYILHANSSMAKEPISTVR